MPQAVLLNSNTIGFSPRRLQLPSSHPVIWKAPSPTSTSGRLPLAGLQAEAKRNARTHGGIIPRCQQGGVLYVHGGEQAVAHVGCDGHDTMVCKEIVDRGCNVLRFELVFGGFEAGWIGGCDSFRAAEFFRPRQQRVHKGFKHNA